MRSQPGGEIGGAGGGAQAFRGKDHVGCDAKQRIVLVGRPVAVEDHRHVAPPRRLTDRLHESRIAVVGQHRVRGCDDLVRIGRCRRGDAFIAIGHDGAVAARIHEDRRQRRRQAVDALAERAVDLFARECSQHAIAVGVLARGSAHRAGERRAAAEAGDRHRRIGRAAAVDHEKSRRLHFAVGLRELLDAKHLVEHDDAGAEDARRGDRGHVNQSRTWQPSSTKLRMR